MERKAQKRPVYRKPDFEEPELDEEESEEEYEDMELSGGEDFEEDSEQYPQMECKGGDRRLLLILASLGAVLATVAGIVFFLFLKDGREQREEVVSRLEQSREDLSAQDQERTDAADPEEDGNGGEIQDGDSAQPQSGQDVEEDPERDSRIDQSRGQSDQMGEGGGTDQVSVGALDDQQDPQGSGAAGNETSGAAVTVAPLGEGETAGTTMGIDVSKYQGTIDWKKVRQSGVEFAMIRVGYRARTTGEIFEDPTARYNMQEAQGAGIKLGAYFFSTAVTQEEARAEAAFTTEIISKYKITYPVAYNCEDFLSPDSRQNGLDRDTRTLLACTFLDEVAAAGYTPMFYAARGELEGSALWDTQTLAGKYRIWVAQYPAQPWPQTQASDYTGTHHMWQYTSQGTVAGIPGKTDVNVAYFGYTAEARARDETPAEVVSANPEVGIIFTEVNETVTAKQETNLRSEPSTLNDASITARLVHGDTATRTGIGHNGWSRVIYNGQTLYAVSSYLTTDMEDTGQEAPPQGPVYTPVNERVTAKIETNLRLQPGTESDDTVVGLLKNGEVLTRTAIGDNGWSQLDYNGQTVYAVSSFLTAAE